MVKRYLIPSLLLGATLTGCTVGPEFRRPESPSNALYLDASELTQAQSHAPGTVLGDGAPLRWWEAFGSVDLNSLVDRALAGNHSLAASNATLERARHQLAAIAGTRRPQVDANARIDYQRVNRAASGFNVVQSGIGAANPAFDLYSVGGGISYDLDLFGGKRRHVEQAAARAEAQLRQTEAAHLTIAGRVVNQVLTIAAIRARIETADILLAEDQHIVDLTDMRRRSGKGNLVEVLSAQSKLASDRAARPELDQQLAEARHMLAVLVGIAPSDLGSTNFDLGRFALPGTLPVTLPSALVHKRPDILQAEADLHAATAGVGVATARLYPNVMLGASLSQGAPDIGNLLGAGFRAFDVLAGLSAPLFRGGTLKADKRAAEADAHAAAAAYQQTVIEAFGQVADLLVALQSDAHTVSNQRQAAEVASRSLNLSRRSFEVGNSGVLQVLDSNRTYQQARAALVEAQSRQFLNVARLFVATAGGWTGPIPSSPNEAFPTSTMPAK